MLPFDNKSEFQIILNMPEGSALERTAQAAREIAAAVRVEPEVTDYQVYAGVAAPFNFNGLVRHYFMRRGAHVADLQINLVSKSERKAQSHDIAKRVRPRVAAIAAKYGARVAVAEVPPGPPVLQTLVAEIYGPERGKPPRPGAQGHRHLPQHPGRGGHRLVHRGRPAQGALRHRQGKGRPPRHQRRDHCADPASWPSAAHAVDLLHLPREKEDVRYRGATAAALPHHARGPAGPARPLGANPPAPLVPLRELVKVEPDLVDKSIYHKNLMPVTYVIGDVAGVVESPVYAILKMNKALARARHQRVRRQRRAAQDLQRHPALHRRRARHEMGRRMAHHHRSLPRPRHRPLPRCWC